MQLRRVSFGGDLELMTARNHVERGLPRPNRDAVEGQARVLGGAADGELRRPCLRGEGLRYLCIELGELRRDCIE
ncbi:hypothetical protein ENSA7_20420 [Enhygromyxa salina]|uniref:Uncharacterized protein n=1 Tax=Enhygromyxa salina TaxID=215803 RepID=A0A2S9YTH2_9BACT|nr:hypothetical protein ENSA7_20420 [Enhygromyxa salina]